MKKRHKDMFKVDTAFSSRQSVAFLDKSFIMKNTRYKRLCYIYISLIETCHEQPNVHRNG